MRVTPDGGERKALIVALHGAGQRPRDALFVFRAAWNEPGIVVVAPASAGRTWARWDDVEGIDDTLRAAFARCPVDPERVAVGGFSDGATYALSLAVANGNLFEAAIALAPGGVVSESVVGRPRFFLAHGTRDPIIPIERGSALIVPVLRDFGYPVTYRTFEGGHEVPRAISAAAVDWFLGR